MDKKDVIWNDAIPEIVAGYKEKEEYYQCVFCGKKFQKGEIYPIGDKFYDCYGAAKKHTKECHGHAVDYLLEQEPALLGISEIQQQILKLMSSGKDDKAIAAEVGIAQSTVRNHRFKLREKEKQAKLFLALMTSLEEKTSRGINETDAGVIEEVHQTAKMVDDRYDITSEERVKTIKTYFNENGALLQFPAREKKKIIVLSEIMKNFVKDREYSEREVNQVLERIFDDYPTIRRALIEYGFFDRSSDCSVYRVKE